MAATRRKDEGRDEKGKRSKKPSRREEKRSGGTKAVGGCVIRLSPIGCRWLGGEGRHRRLCHSVKNIDLDEKGDQAGSLGGGGWSWSEPRIRCSNIHIESTWSWLQRQPAVQLPRRNERQTTAARVPAERDGRTKPNRYDGGRDRKRASSGHSPRVK